MNMFGSQIGSFHTHEEKPVSEKAWLTSIIGIAVSLVSVILAQFQKQQARFWGVIAVGALTAVVGLYRPLFIYIRKLRRKIHNGLVVRRNSNELRRFSRQTGIFLDSGSTRNDVLAGILHDISARQSQLVVAARIPHAGIFHDHWHYLHTRIHASNLNAKGFHDAAEELLSLLRSYTTFSVLPLFHTFAAEYRETLNDADKSKMNAFQQQYTVFLGSYAAFLHRLNDEFQGMPEFHAEMAKPQPL